MNKIASSLDVAKQNRGFINAGHLDATTLHRGYWLRGTNDRLQGNQQVACFGRGYAD
jgi:hypothetical protein